MRCDDMKIFDEETYKAIRKQVHEKLKPMKQVIIKSILEENKKEK